MKIKNILRKGNLRFQQKLFEGKEYIDNDESIPHYPVLFLTCMDPRIDVHRIFQLEPGDAFILRNAGNLYTKDVLRALLIAIHEYNVKLVIVLGHTDCGMTKLSMNELKEELMHQVLWHISKKGLNPLKEIERFFRPFIDEFKNINDQIEVLKYFKGFPAGIDFTGMLYDVKTGWVFDMEELQEYQYIEEFMFNYKDLLKNKRKDFKEFLFNRDDDTIAAKGLEVDYTDKINKLESLLDTQEREEWEDNLDISLDLLPKRFDSAKFLQDKKINLSLIIPKISIPKIRFPKIKVHIQNINKSKKLREND